MQTLKCPQNKRQFATQEQCNKWIDIYNKTKKKGEYSLGNSYMCSHCLTWHSTSQKAPERVDPDEIVSLLYDQKEFIKFLCEELQHNGYNKYKDKLRFRYGKLITQNWVFISRLKKMKSQK